MDLATRLAPVREVLAAGWIDLPRARLFAQATEGLAAAHAAAVVATVLPHAPDLTSGRLRRALDRAVLAADPGSAQKQRDAALAQARVDCWPDPCGTANLAGRNLPAASVLAADKRLDAIARHWQRLGAQGGIDQLRARAYLTQLLDQDTTQPPADLLAPATPSGSPGERAPASQPSSDRRHGLPRPSDPDHGYDLPWPPSPADQHSKPRSVNSNHRHDLSGPSDPDHRHDPPRPLSPADRHSQPGPSGPDDQHDLPGPAGPDHRHSLSGPASPPGQPSPTGQPGSWHQPPDSPRQQIPAGPQPPPPAGHPPPAELPPLAGSVNLTLPLTTLLGLASQPGEATGYGPLDASTARALACAAAGHRATRWHITLTSPTGRALGYGSTPASHAHTTRDGAWQISVTAEPIAAGGCDHHAAEPHYRPSAGLQRIIRARTTTCTCPGCARPAARCDLDHSIAYDDGGLTCPCNLAPLCRRHHRLKQTQHWTLEQPTPGVMAWLTPSGRRYIVLPSQHPA